MSRRTMQRVTGDGVQIQLAVWEGEEPTVFCIHSMLSSCLSWSPIAEILAPQYRVMALDLRGRGRSERPPTGYSIKHHAADVCRILDDLGLDRVVLMGHSLGVHIALELAAQQPSRVEKMVMIDAGGQLSAKQWQGVGVAIKPSLERLSHVYADTEEFISTAREAGIIRAWSPWVDEYMRYQVEPTDEGVVCCIKPHHIQEEMANNAGFQPIERYASLSFPVLVLRATQGIGPNHTVLLPSDAVERMKKEIANLTVVDVEGLDHYNITLASHEGRDRALLQFLAA